MSKIAFPEPHDIVKVMREAQSFRLAPLSDLGQKYWQRSPYHVVRRAINIHEDHRGCVPIGVRGDSRQERFGAYIPKEWIEGVVTPLSLVQEQAWLKWDRSEKFLNIVDTLNLLRQSLCNYPIGIGGSVGYELIANLPVVRQTSDIDLILYSEHLLAKSLTIKEANDIMDIVKNYAVTIDIQVQNTRGAFHLHEYAQNSGASILLKTSQGPILSKDIW